MREVLYRWLGTDEFRKLKHTYPVAQWVDAPQGSSAAVAGEQIFQVNFTSKDFYRTNQSLIDRIVEVGSRKVNVSEISRMDCRKFSSVLGLICYISDNRSALQSRPEQYGITPGSLDRAHIEDVAKDLMDSARSGYRQSLRTGVQAEKEDREKHERYRGVERHKTVSSSAAGLPLCSSISHVLAFFSMISYNGGY